MHSLQDLRDKLFSDSLEILRDLSVSAHPELLLEKEQFLKDLSEKITVLKYLEKNKNFFGEGIKEIQAVTDPGEKGISDQGRIKAQEREKIKKSIAEIKTNSREMTSVVGYTQQKRMTPHNTIKKIRLSPIKGVHTKKGKQFSGAEKIKEVSMNKAFEVKKVPLLSSVKISGIKLDLNDKISFCRILFSGDQEEFDEVIEKINAFHSAEEAKVFFSVLYHEKRWEKADDYAQRLWTLVENKFY
ncbi:MAG: hypothetical protein FDW93_05345 [Bergeyella sp.]|nr:hypothetical protein [Bergeyella sp.]